MAAYTPPTIADLDAFDAAAVLAGFTDLATAINGNVESTNNVTTNATMDYRHIHRDALTGVWKTTSRGVVASMPVRYLSAAEAAALGVQAGRYCIWLNKFDVEDCSIRIHLPHAAHVHVSANIDLTYAKTANVAGTTFTHDVVFKLYRNGSVVDTDQLVMVEASADAARLPIQGHMERIESLAAGTYDYWVEADFRGSTAAPDVNEFIHWVSVSRGMQIVANYRQ